MYRSLEMVVAVAAVVAALWLDVPRLLLAPLVVLVLVLTGRRHWRDWKAQTDSPQLRRQLVILCGTAVVVSLPLVLGAIPPNNVYGFRTAVTRSGLDTWHTANAFAGSALIVAGVASAVVLLRLPPTTARWQLLAVYLVPIASAVAASFWYLNRLS